LFTKNLLTKSQKCDIISTSKGREIPREREEIKMLEWLKEAWYVVAAIVFGVICIAALVIACVYAINTGDIPSAGESQLITSWTVNPANPASPLHGILP
jgi:hypothetical protein